MDDAEFLARQQGKIATRMIRIAAILAQQDLTQGDLIEIETAMQAIRYISEGKPKGMDAEIASLARAVALRAVASASTGISEAEVVAFGNSAHVILPKTLIGKKIQYSVVE